MRTFLAVLMLLGPFPALAQNVSTIGGKQYAEGEFALSGPDAGCPGSHHHAANFSFATALDGTMLFDPDPFGCGYGLLAFAPLGGAAAAAAAPAMEPSTIDLFLAGLGLYTPEAAAGLPPDPRAVPPAIGPEPVAGPLPYDLNAAGEAGIPEHLLHEGSGGTTAPPGAPLVSTPSTPSIGGGLSNFLVGGSVDAPLVIPPLPPMTDAELAALREAVAAREAQTAAVAAGREEFRSATISLLEKIEREAAQVGLYHWTIPAALDSSYFHRQGEQFVFEGTPMNGGEVNYYYQGLYWRLAGVPSVVMEGIIRGYKAVEYQSAPSDADLQTAHDGYRDMDSAIRYADSHTQEEAEQRYRENMGEDARLPRSGDNVSTGIFAHFSDPQNLPSIQTAP